MWRPTPPLGGRELVLRTCRIYQGVNKHAQTCFFASVQDNDSGNVTVMHSSFSHNEAGENGAGIFNNLGTVTVIQSTLSHNEAGDNGGGVFTFAFSTLTVTHSTLIGNRAGANGSGVGGGWYSDDATVTLRHSIIAGNFRGLGTTANDMTTVVPLHASSSHNLIGDPNSAGGLMHGVNGNIVGDDDGNPLDVSTILDPVLRDNGGLTPTHALVSGSPAINAGNPAFNNADLPFDQRGAGFARIRQGRIDIGAVEATPASVDLQQLVDNATAGEVIPVAVSDAIQLTELLAAIETLEVNPEPGNDPVIIELHLPSGTYSGQTVSVPDGIILVIRSAGEVVFTSGSPALTVRAGQVLVHTGVTFRVSTNDPTILVESGGSLTLNGVTIHESDGFDRVAILVHAGGELDLSSDNNLLNVRGAGQLIEWRAGSTLDITGSTLQIDGATLDANVLADNFTLEDAMTHALDDPSFGLVTWAGNQVFVTPGSGRIQNAIQAVATGGTIHILAGTYTEADIVVDRDVTLVGAGRVLVDAAGVGRVFDIVAGTTVVFNNLTITGGLTPATGADADISGGGLRNLAGIVTLVNSTIAENRAVGDGGGIYNTGSLTVLNSTISGNVADGHGGGVSNAGNATITQSTITGNLAGGHGGGLITAPAAQTLRHNTLIVGNTSDLAGDNTWPVNLDVDGDGEVQALTDGLLILRYLFGFSGAALTASATNLAGTRTTPEAISSFLQQDLSPVLDVDGNSSVEPLTDGLLVLRYLFGFNGEPLMQDALGAGAARTTSETISAYLELFMPAQPLHAESLGAVEAPPLTESELQPVAVAAQTYWNETPLAPLLPEVQAVITDLPGTLLGLVQEGVIYIDHNGAGLGWFIDVTPFTHEEFSSTLNPYLGLAQTEPANGRMDLLTVVLHELGHLAGLDDEVSALGTEGLMCDTLAPGTRRLPSPEDLAAVLADAWPDWEAF